MVPTVFIKEWHMPHIGQDNSRLLKLWPWYLISWYILDKSIESTNKL